MTPMSRKKSTIMSMNITIIDGSLNVRSSTIHG